ncbi:hypothetical protein Rsub_01979 [Raphidocelis subcapitata]|uniref:Feruloyl esterase n=1 Tax=Raphidocelis subcapitata TaxID=307507 RepID=A0A2V0NWU3_9CHLO|nr:hypothetical protein Rsub_01979 [Raphidocelis subcapitata]|eukprot:GBF89407.1 hypothetical protein Rsub_01979 [Raphidocelis subcapitata]
MGLRGIVLLLLALLAGAAARAPPRADCAAGNLECACAAAGGAWHAYKPPLEPVCTVTILHQDRERTFNIFLPRAYDARAQKYPVWVHLHGVYWASMDDISARMGFTVQATEATPMWDTLSTGPYRDTAVAVYPQALPPGGDAFKRTFWNNPFWHCSVDVCADPSIDDIGFIEKVFLELPARLSMDRKKVFLSGTSAGGMMLHTLLCSSPIVSHFTTAAVDLIGGLGESMRHTCRDSHHVPLRIIHGENDTVLHFDEACEVDGVRFLSTRDTAAMWKERYGCASEPDAPDVWGDGITTCDALCAKKGLLELCRMRGIGHQLDVPTLGYPFTAAWEFFKSVAGMK